MLALYLSMLDTQEDKDRFEEIYKKYYISMFNISFSILHNNEDAKDAVHEAFLCIANKFKKIAPLNCQKMKSYIVIIIRNVSLNMYKKNKRRGENNDNIDNHEIPVEVDFFEKMEYSDLVGSIKELPDDYRDVMFLRYREGLSINEIAKILDINQTLVYKRIERAKKQLKEILEKGGTYV